METDWPRYELLFYLADDIQPDDVAQVEGLLAALSRVRPWVLGPPRLVDETEDVSADSSDEPIRTLGGALELHEPRHQGADLELGLDRAHLAEVEALVADLAKFSKESGHRIELWLGQTFAGTIEDGEIGRELRVGLLEEWRRVLDERRHP